MSYSIQRQWINGWGIGMLSLLTILLAPITYANAASDLTVGSVTGAPGNSVAVPVTADFSVGVSAIQFTVTFDSNLLTVSSVTGGTATPNSSWFILSNSNTPGTVIVGLVYTGSGSSGVSGSGQQVAIINFTVNNPPGDANTSSALTPSAVTFDSATVTSLTAGTFTLNVSENLSAVASPSLDGSVTCGNSTTTCPSTVNNGTSEEFFANINSGYALTGWTVSGSTAGAGCSGTAGTCTVSITGNTTVTANFTTATETLTATASPSIDGSVTCGNDSTACTSPINEGTSEEFFANPNSGFSLSSWTVTGSTPGAGCSGTSGTCTVVMTAATTVTANFIATPETLTVAASPSPEGTVTCGNSSTACAGSVAENASVVFYANPTAGYGLSSWTVTGSAAGAGCSGTSGTCTVSVTTATSVTANFASVPETLTVAASPSLDGTVTCGNSSTACASPVDGGSSVEFFANTNAGFALSSWTVIGSTPGAGCSGTSGTCTVIITATTSVTANFAAIQEGLIVAGAPSAGGSVSYPSKLSDNSTVNDDATIVFTSNPAGGYTLSSWTVTGSSPGAGCSGTSGTCTVTITASTTVTANYALIPVAASFTLQPVSQTVIQPETATFTVAATGIPSPNSYQWQSSPDGVNWTPISGATGTSYTTGATTSGVTYYDCVVSNGVGSPAPSNSVTLTVTIGPIAGVCGSAAQSYANGTTSFGSNTLCSAGNANPASVAFPASNATVTWTCQGLNGGASPSCSATQIPKLVVRVRI